MGSANNLLYAEGISIETGVIVTLFCLFFIKYISLCHLPFLYFIII